MSKYKIDTWIKAGYALYGREGMSGIKIERLARDLQLNKSGFYHYFGTMETFTKNLIQYHIATARIVAREIEACENLDPDVLLLMVKHKEFFLAESRLLLKSRPLYLNSEVEEARRLVNKELLPFWRKATKLPDDSVAALSYLNIILHFFYARINPDTLAYEFLHTLTSETEEVLNKVIETQHASSPKTEKPSI